MFDPSIQILMYLSTSFFLGLLLGWVLWWMKLSTVLKEQKSEVQFWKDRCNEYMLGGGLTEEQKQILKQPGTAEV
jgi:hypothetical protein